MFSSLSFKKVIFLSIFLVVILFFLANDAAMFFHQKLRISFFDVLEGEATLIKTKNGKNILIDAGSKNFIIEKLADHLSFFDKKINLFVLSSFQKSNIEGGLVLLERFDVDEVLISKKMKNSNTLKEFITLAHSKNMRISFATPHRDIQIGKHLLLDVISEQQAIVSRLIYNNIPLLLFTGDITKEEERNLLQTSVSIKSDLLKIGKHGSSASTSSVFLQNILPKKVIIFAHDDEHKQFPHLETLEKLTSSQILITKQMGDIVLEF